MSAPAFSPGRLAFRQALFAFDVGLRRANRVFEFDAAPECIFRVSLGEAGRSYAFTDGSRLAPRDPVADLHFWNEHLPAMPAAGPTLLWAGLMRRSLNSSFSALSRTLARRPDLAPVRAVRLATLLGQGGGEAQIGAILKRYGFERAEGPETLDIGDNALTLLFTLACNPRAARLDLLGRRKAVFMIPRRRFDERFGKGAGGAAP